MIKENFFTGEPVGSGSPGISDVESNASFGATYYNNMGNPALQSNIIHPGGYGYNQQPMPMYGYNPYMGPYMNQYYNPYYQQQSRYEQPKTIQFKVEPAYNQEYMPTYGWEEKAHQLEMEYWTKEQEEEVKRNMDRAKAGGYMGYGGMYNYYGNPFYNPYQYSNTTRAVSGEIEKIKQEARDNRTQFQFNLSKLAHNYLGDNISDDKIMERCTGKVITVDNPQYVQEYYQSFYDRFQNLVPFDNSSSYREHSAAVSREHDKIIPKDCDLDTFFKNLGILGAEYAMEEENHSRRDDSILYQSENNAYKVYVQKQAAERYKREVQRSATTGEPVMAQRPNMSQMFPTLSQSARLTEDGTLNITCNFGSKAGETYSVHNSMEAEYEKDRERFQAFLNSIPGAIYNPKDDPGGD